MKEIDGAKRETEIGCLLAAIALAVSIAIALMI
jgi:hypothetical protein